MWLKLCRPGHNKKLKRDSEIQWQDSLLGQCRRQHEEQCQVDSIRLERLGRRGAHPPGSAAARAPSLRRRSRANGDQGAETGRRRRAAWVYRD